MRSLTRTVVDRFKIQDSYTFDIDPLNDAVIYEFDDLFNIGIKVIEKEKCKK